MGFSIFAKKVNNTSFTEGITLRLFPVNASGKIEYNTLVAEKTMSVDNLDSISAKPLKITFPSVAVTKGQKYAIVLSSQHEDGLYIYGSVLNKNLKGYTLSKYDSRPEANGYEFNDAVGPLLRASKGGFMNITSARVFASENLIAPNKAIVAKSNIGLSSILIGADPSSIDTIGSKKFFPSSKTTYLAGVDVPVLNNERYNIINISGGKYVASIVGNGHRANVRNTGNELLVTFIDKQLSGGLVSCSLNVPLNAS